MRLPILLALTILPLMQVEVMAEESMFYGLLRSRDLTPFGFVRLDMRPDHAVSVDAVRIPPMSASDSD
jgi:hypothetical protein